MFSLTTRPATQTELDELNRRQRLANRLDGWFIGCTLVLTLLAAFATALIVALLVWFGQVAEPGASFTSTYVGNMKWCLLVLGGVPLVLILGNFLSNIFRRRYRHPVEIEDLEAIAIAAARVNISLDHESPLLFLLVEPTRVLVLSPQGLLPESFTTRVPGTYQRTMVDSIFTIHESLSGTQIPVSTVEVPQDFHPGLTCLTGHCVNLEDLPLGLRQALAMPAHPQTLSD